MCLYIYIYIKATENIMDCTTKDSMTLKREFGPQNMSHGGLESDTMYEFNSILRMVGPYRRWTSGSI